MRNISTDEITAAVCRLFIDANYNLSPDMTEVIANAYKAETSPVCKDALESIVTNLDVAKKLDVPICQDTGMAVLFCKIGQEVHISGGSFNNAVNEGVRQAYIKGCMRCSVVKDPLNRVNTGDNTPAVIHIELTEGDRITLTAAPKGFGSENMSAIRMFTPSASREDILVFIRDTVVKAGSRPCPPVVIGVGIGGTFDLCPQLAKKALTRAADVSNADPFYAKLEKDALALVNATGIGAQGFGGDITALTVNIETYPTHIAGLPVAINMGCHVNRHKTCVI